MCYPSHTRPDLCLNTGGKHTFKTRMKTQTNIVFSRIWMCSYLRPVKTLN